MKQNRISKAVLRDALSVAGGLCRMNASSSIGYAFCVNGDNTEVSTGWFVFTGETVSVDYMDGFIDFENETYTDLLSNKTKSIETI